ncbi:berberine/berberine-like protein [Tanacetum coccineum]
MLDSITLMTPTQALDSIQIMVDHSHNWYDGATTRERTNDSLDNVDMKKLKENIHVFQVSCKICKEEHLTKECPLKKEDKAVEQSKSLDTTTKYLQVQADQLAQMVLTNTGKRVKAKTKMGKEDMKEPVPRDLPVVQPYVPLTPFPRHIKEQKGNSYKTREAVCMIGIPKKTHNKVEVDEGGIDDGWDKML